MRYVRRKRSFFDITVIFVDIDELDHRKIFGSHRAIRARTNLLVKMTSTRSRLETRLTVPRGKEKYGR